jgi:3-phosphoshikimate 1-carboxyvinyltransferase
LGARFEELGAPDPLPLGVHGGGLRPLDFDSPRASAQVKSALLLAGLTGGVRASVTEPVLSRDHTERMLRAMGVRIDTSATDGGRIRIDLQPRDSILPLDIVVPGDFSSAAFFLGYGTLVSSGGIRMEGVGINPTRTGLLDVLRRMGARIEVTDAHDSGGEPVADLRVQAARLTATRVEAAELPSLIDEVPILAVLAARADGETRIEGAGELRVKESDRLAAIAENLRAVGVEAADEGDTLHVRGRGGTLRGRVRSFGDHRIAMAFGVLGAEPGNEIVVDDPSVVAVSFPGFWNALTAGAS